MRNALSYGGNRHPSSAAVVCKPKDEGGVIPRVGCIDEAQLSSICYEAPLQLSKADELDVGRICGMPCNKTGCLGLRCSHGGGLQ